MSQLRSRINAAIQEKSGLIIKEEWLKRCLAHLENEDNSGSGTKTITESRSEQDDSDVLEKVWQQLLDSPLELVSHATITLEKEASGFSKYKIPSCGTVLEIAGIEDVGVSKYKIYEQLQAKIEAAKRNEQISLISNIETRDLLRNVQQTRATNAWEPGQDTDLNAELELDLDFDFDPENQNDLRQRQGYENNTDGYESDGPGRNQASKSGYYGSEKTATVNGLSRKMLKVMFTDGVIVIPAVEINQMDHFHLELPIGTKVFIINPTFIPPSNMMILSKNFTILGGKPRCYQHLSLLARISAALGKNIPNTENLTKNTNNTTAKVVNRDNGVDSIEIENIEIYSDLDDFEDFTPIKKKPSIRSAKKPKKQ